MRWELCVAYGPKPVITTTTSDGARAVEQSDVDSDKAVEAIMRACRD